MPIGGALLGSRDGDQGSGAVGTQPAMAPEGSRTGPMIIVDERSGPLEPWRRPRLHARVRGELARRSRGAGRLARSWCRRGRSCFCSGPLERPPVPVPRQRALLHHRRSILGGLARLGGSAGGGRQRRAVMADPAASSDAAGGLAGSRAGAPRSMRLLLYVLSALASVWWIIVLQSVLVSWLTVTFLDLVWSGPRPGAVMAGSGRAWRAHLRRGVQRLPDAESSRRPRLAALLLVSTQRRPAEKTSPMRALSPSAW